MPKYKFIEAITSDVIYEAYGKTKKEVFENAALALFSVICKLKSVKPKKSKKIIVKGKDLKDLLFKFLQSIIASVDTEEMFFSKCKINSLTDKQVSATLYGEEITPGKGETSVKGVTYYKYMLEETAKGYVSRVSLDI